MLAFRMPLSQIRTPTLAGYSGRGGRAKALPNRCRPIFVGTWTCRGEEHRLGVERLQFLELRILPAERLGHFHFRAFKMLMSCSVDHGFALKMIVGDDKRFAGALP